MNNDLSLVIIFKEEGFEFLTKLQADGELFITMGMLFQHFAPKLLYWRSVWPKSLTFHTFVSSTYARCIPYT